MSLRKVLFITHHFTPANSAGVFRSVRFVKHLPEFGWTPVILTATPGGSEVSTAFRIERVPSSASDVESSSSRSSRTVSFGNGGRKYRPPGFQFAKNLRQLLVETPDQHVFWNRRAVQVARRLIREEQPVALYTTGPPHSVHLGGLALKRLTNLPWVVDFRDPCARRPWTKRGNPWGNRLMPKFERLIVKSANQVILNTERSTADFRKFYPELPASKFLTIPNGCDSDFVSSVEAQMMPLNVNQMPQQVRTLLHPGSCYGRRDPRIIVDAIASLAKLGQELRFCQIGFCAPKFELLRYARERNVEHLVCVEEAVPHEEILRQMAAADMLLIIQPEAPLMVPGKLYEMIAFRKPIVAVTDEGATSDLMRQYQLGPVVGSNDVAGLARSLAELCSRQKPDFGTSPSGVAAALQAFDGRALTGQLATVFDKLNDLRQAV